MEPRPWYRYAGRFVLPLVLIASAVAAWFLAAELSTTDQAQASSDDVEQVDVPLASVRRLPVFVSTAARDAAVADALAGLPEDPGGLSCVSVWLDGEPVLELRSDRGLVPSYAQIFITGHAALEILGPEYRYETQLLANASPDLNGRIFGGAYLLGGGDPVLMSFGYSIGFRPVPSTRTAIEELAEATARAGVLRIDGGVIGVENRYDTQRSLPGVPTPYLEAGTIGVASALQLDDGFAQWPGSNLGIAVPAEQPAAMAAERFADELWDIDVQVFDGERALGPDEQLPNLVVVSRVFSDPLSEIIFQTMAVNDATAAELILKELGVADRAMGTTQAGGQAVQRVLTDQGVTVPVPFRDGSGLDPIGGTSCDQLVGTAESIVDDHPTLDVMPAYDLPGVFDGALNGIDLEADLRLVGGVSLEASGFVARTVDDGPRVTIASIINRSTGPTDDDLVYQRALVEMVDGLRSSGTFEE